MEQGLDNLKDAKEGPGDFSTMDSDTLPLCHRKRALVFYWNNSNLYGCLFVRLHQFNIIVRAKYYSEVLLSFTFT